MKINNDFKKIEELLTRGVEQVLPSKEGLKGLMQKRKIRLYLGIDPTGTKLHLGHTIALRKLQEFVDLGHEAILIIGTGTVLAGDPSLREVARTMITKKEVIKNIKTWKKQASKVLELSKVKVKYNGDWLLKLRLEDIIKICSHISAVKLFQRDMFQRRMEKGDTVWTHEILYPVLQGYDSVYLKTDLEIGGTDQTFNMLIGRELEQKIINKEKFVLTVPMILGIDGRQMSKTSGNCIWISDSPSNKYGKIMSIPDNLILSYFQLLTNLPLEEIEKIKKDLTRKELNPRDAKARLAFEIVKMYHSRREAKKAEEEFNRVFREKKVPRQMPTFVASKKIYPICELLTQANLAPSKSEAKRLVLQGGVKLDQKVIEDWQQEVELKDEMVIQVGKRKFIKIKYG